MEKRSKPTNSTEQTRPAAEDAPAVQESPPFPIAGPGASAGGLEALVQEPSSAKFDSMPRGAIAAGLADLVAPAEELRCRDGERRVS